MIRKAYTVTFTSAGTGPETIIRLRRMLKISLRSFGLRCTAIAATEAQDATQGHGMDSEADRPLEAPTCEP